MSPKSQVGKFRLWTQTQDYKLKTRIPKQNSMTLNSSLQSSSRSLDASSVAVLHTMMYFDVFRHPLTTDEIRRNCQWRGCTLSETAAALEDLQQKGFVAEEEGYWFIRGKNNLVQLRREREERAAHFLRKAKKYASFISGFPFVRGVYISGSLSKGTMDPNGDIDYFIITAPRRLWVARSLLVLFKKIFLLNSRKYFCVNYFIDTEQLAIPDRNLFVATEINFIRPMSNGTLYSDFMRSNHWVELFYPNSVKHAADKIPEPRNGRMKRTLEKILQGNLGEWLDDRLLRITLNRWKKKFPYVAGQDFEVDFRSRRHVSKHHPQGFQRRVSTELERRRLEMTEATGIYIPAMKWEWSVPQNPNP
jgi:hypothetical protein